MDTGFDAIFYPWEVSLLLGPVLGFLLRRPFRRGGRKLRFSVYPMLAAVVAVGLVVSFSPVSFRGAKVGAMAGAAGYVAFCILAFAALSWGQFGKPVFFAMAVPMVAGIVLATIGIIGLGLILGDTIPDGETWVNPEYSCRFNSYGNATTSDGGVTVSVLYHPRFAPALEWRRYSRSFDFREYMFKDVSSSLDPDNGGVLIITAPHLNGPAERIAFSTK